jgi:hypothetical protein
VRFGRIIELTAEMTAEGVGKPLPANLENSNLVWPLSEVVEEEVEGEGEVD